MSESVQTPGSQLAGKIDIHSHLLPGVDDGCQTLEESLECIRRLKAVGYVGTICTPHVIPSAYPNNTPANVKKWVELLRGEIAACGIEYEIWAGGEVQLFEDLVPWLDEMGYPTLAGSKCLLVDIWKPRWPDWATGVLGKLIERGYQPVLAHPERLPCVEDIDHCIPQIIELGVWMQGNFRSFQGGEGPVAEHLVRRFMRCGAYRFMAMDMHRPDKLAERIEGLRMMEAEFGSETVRQLVSEEPRRQLLTDHHVPA